MSNAGNSQRGRQVQMPSAVALAKEGIFRVMAPASRRQRSRFTRERRRCRSAAACWVRSRRTDRNAKRAGRFGNSAASQMPSFGRARSNEARLGLPISRMIVGTRRIGWARSDFRTRRRLVVNRSRSRRVALERYINWHRKTDGHEARDRIWADARCVGRLRRRLTAAADQGQSQRANNGRPHTILRERLSAAAALAA